MKLIQTGKYRGQFKPVCSTRSGQLAIMELHPGGESDEEISNEHPRSEQWCFVLSGTGKATILTNQTRRNVALRPGSLLVIEKGERHQIRNTGRQILRTLNFYLPPAYDAEGNVKKKVKRS